MPARASGRRRSTPPVLRRERQSDAIGMHDGARRAGKLERDAAVRLKAPPHLLPSARVSVLISKVLRLLACCS